MREIRLYGHLGKKFGRSFRLDVKTPAEAVRALQANFSDFEAYMQKFANQGFRVQVGKEYIDPVGLVTESESSTISITPVVSGAGRGVGQIILGGLIIAAAFSGWGSFAIAALSPTAAAATAVTASLVSFGVSMVIGGVVQMLTKAPGSTSKEAASNKPSYAFNGPVNTTAQGGVVPICYGEMIVGSQVISAGLKVEQGFTPPTYTPSTRARKTPDWEDTNEY